MRDLPALHPVREILKGRNLYLVGMMGSGKSSTGDPLANSLRYSFIDTDSVIETLFKKSIKNIFDDHGEEQFRDAETEVLQSIGQRHSLVVATGGGIVLKPENWGVLHQGIVIWLNPDLNQLTRRLKSEVSKRPLLNKVDPETSLASLLKERKRFYSEADLNIKVQEETPEAVANLILQNLQSILTDPQDPSAQQTTAK